MQYPKQSITIILIAALSMGSVQAMEPPQKKQTFLQRLVMQYKVNRDLTRQHQIHAIKLSKTQLEQIRADQRRILKRVVLAGLTTAFLAALGVAAAVGIKKYREKGELPKAPPAPSVTPAGPPEAPAPAWKPGVRRLTPAEEADIQRRLEQAEAGAAAPQTRAGLTPQQQEALAELRQQPPMPVTETLRRPVLEPGEVPEEPYEDPLITRLLEEE